MKKVKSFITIVILLIGFVGIGSLTSCTENSRAKNFGGTARVNLPVGKQLDMVTWKDADLWILTSNRASDVTPKVYTFNEESSWGVFEGSYIITEK